MTLKRQTINLCTMATALPPQKLFNFLGGLVENFVTLRKKFHIFHRYCTQTVTTSFSKFHTQSAHLLLFKSTHASWPPLYPPKSVRGMFQQCSRGVPAVFHQCCTSVPAVFLACFSSVQGCMDSSVPAVFQRCSSSFPEEVPSLFISLHLPSPGFISLHLPSSPFISLHFPSSAFISIHLQGCSSSVPPVLYQCSSSVPEEVSSLFISLHLPSPGFISLHLPSSPFISIHLPSFPFICFHLPSSSRVFQQRSRDVPAVFQKKFNLSSSPFISLHLPSPVFISLRLSSSP